MPRVVTISVFLLLAVVAVIGCGSGGVASPSTGPADPPPTKARFLREADAICSSTDIAQTKALKAYVKKYPAAKSKQSAEKRFVLKIGLPMVQDEAEEVGGLSVPKGDAQELREWVDTLEAAVREAEAKPERLLKGPAESPFTSVEKLGRAYGFSACAEPL
jgi:hypothetical protein